MSTLSLTNSRAASEALAAYLEKDQIPRTEYFEIAMVLRTLTLSLF